MTQESVTFQLNSEKKNALDTISAAMERDRNQVLNDAIELYLETYHVN